MFDRFTDRARKVMNLAKGEAQRLNHQYIGTEHILLGLIQEGTGVAANVLRNMGIDLKRIRAEIEKLVKGSSTVVPMGNLPFTPRAKKVLELSLDEARQIGHNYIGTEHLLLGLIKESEGIAARVLTNLGVKLEEVRDEVLDFIGAQSGEEAEDGLAPGEGGEKAGGQGKTPALDAFGRDLTELARGGRIDLVIGRQAEIAKLEVALSRRASNSVVLVGDAGIGRSSIVRGLACKIVEGTVPATLRNRRIIAVDLDAMVSRAASEKEAGERISALVAETLRACNIILFFPELAATLRDSHGAGRSKSLSHLFRASFLSRGGQCIATSLPEDYQRRTEEDAGMTRLLRPIQVGQLSLEDSLEVLKGQRDRFEKHHNALITDAALEAAIELSNLFRPDFCQPSNAVSVVDEACALKLAKDLSPPEFDELQLEIRKLDKEKEERVAEQDFDRAAHVRDHAEGLRKKRDQIEHDWKTRNTEADGTVDASDIEEAISELTGVEIGAVRKRDVTQAPQGSAAGILGIPEFERLQVRSVLHGDIVRIRLGRALVLMPFALEFDGIYRSAVSPALAENGLDGIRADELNATGAVLPQVWELIRTSEVIVVDVSNQNPNVIYEIGLCFGLGRCPILLARKPGDLPFNLRLLRYTPYENTPAGLADLRLRLTDTIRQFLATTRARIERARE